MHTSEIVIFILVILVEISSPLWFTYIFLCVNDIYKRYRKKTQIYPSCMVVVVNPDESVSIIEY